MIDFLLRWIPLQSVFAESFPFGQCPFFIDELMNFLLHDPRHFTRSRLFFLDGTNTVKKGFKTRSRNGPDLWKDFVFGTGKEVVITLLPKSTASGDLP